MLRRKHPTTLSHPKSLRRKRSRNERLALGFLGVVIALGVAALLFSVGRVSVTITARPVAVAADFDVAIIGSGVPSDRELVGRFTTVDGTATAEHRVAVGSASGADLAALPPERAKGIVTLVSTHSSPQPLVATTRLLSSDGVLFRLDTRAAVPAKGKLDGVQVTADQPGVAGNIGPTKFTIPGLSPWLQERIWAESTQPMRGGQGAAGARAAPAVAAAPVPVVTAEDIAAATANARTRATADLRKRAASAAGVAEDAVFVDERVAVETDAKVGDVRDVVKATAVASARALILPRGALEARARAALEEIAASQGRELRRMDDGATTVRIAAEEPAAGRVTIAVHATGTAAVGTSFKTFDPNRLTGFTADDVRSYLQSIPGVEEVDVRLWPFWIQTVPANGKIDVEVREENG